MAEIAVAGFTQRREYSRVAAQIPLEIRLVPPGERPYVHSRSERTSLHSAPAPPDVGDPLLAQWLGFLNAKLDHLLELLTVQQGNRPDFIWTTQDISGGGVSFITADKFSHGDVLELKMLPSAVLPLARYLYGEVVTSEKTADGYLTAVTFIMIDDATRDEIIRFVFERERQILREKRRE